MLFALLGVLGVLGGCGVYESPCYDVQDANVTQYSVNPTAVTPQGLRVDTSGFHLDLQEVDRHAQAVRACLQRLYPDHRLPQALLGPASCLRDTWEPLKACLVVKVPPDWSMGCRGEQVFPCSVDPQLCRDKGLDVTPQCPCSCRDAVQDDGVVVTTPDFHLFDQSLIRLLTSCNQIWVPGLQECFNG